MYNLEVSLFLDYYIKCIWKYVQVDVEGFEEEMAKQRQRSKDSAKSVDLEVGGVLAQLGRQLASTKFNGYTEMEGQGTVLALLRDGQSVEQIQEGNSYTTLFLKTFHLYLKKSAF